MEPQKSVNTFEPFRARIKASIVETCTVLDKVTGKLASYNFTMGRIYDATGKACGIEGKLPTEFKTIVHFELAKLKEQVTSPDGWEHVRSTPRGGMKDGSFIQRRTDSFLKTAVPLETQERIGMELLEKEQKKLDKGPSQEARVKIEKAIKRITKELDFVRKEITAQANLAAEVNAKNEASK